MTESRGEPITGKVLVIDDEIPTAQVLSEFLEEEGHTVTTAYSGTEGMRRLKQNAYDVILTDLWLPDLDARDQRTGGLKILEAARGPDASVEVIIISGHGSLHAIKEAIRIGAYDFIVKPPKWDEVIQTVASAMVKRRLKIERDQLAREAGKTQTDRVTDLLQLYDQLDREMKSARAANQELFDLATRDGLTNLYNFRYLETQLQNMITSKRALKSPLSLIMIDTDDFKSYNDRYGHLKGNEILQQIAQALNANIRETDIAARYGGDEFAVLLFETNKQQAMAFAERCVRLIREYRFDQGDETNRITISAGVASSPEDADTPEALVARADEALYDAKGVGRNQVRAARK